MTSGARRPPHLDAETIAALVDGRLDADERARAQAHLAGCGECYEAFFETSALAEEVGTVASPVRAPAAMPVRRRAAWAWPAGLAAAAAVIAAVWITTTRDPLDAAVRALGSTADASRPTHARLTVNHTWRPAPEVTRGAAAPQPSLAVQEAVVGVRRAAEGRTDARAMHATAVANLVVADLDAAVSGLESAARAFPNDAAIRGDLGAALLERWRRDGAAYDATQALNHLDAAAQLGLDPLVVRFNLALAREALGMRLEAIRAWEEYLAADATSEWAAEARRRLQRLQSTGGGPSARDLPAAALLDLAMQDPSQIYRLAESDRWPIWSRAVVKGERPDGTWLMKAGEMLRHARRDGLMADLAVIATSTATTAAARECLARGMLSLDAARQHYETGAYRTAGEFAGAAARSLACAGAPGVEAEVMAALVDMSIGQTPSALRRVDAIEQQTAGHDWLRARAIAAQIRGISFLQRTAFSDGVRAHEMGLELASQAGDVDLMAASLAYLGTAFDEQGDRQASWRFFRDGLGLADRTVSFRRRYQTYARAAAAAADAGLSGASRAIADGLLRAAEDGGPSWARIAARLQRARALDALHRVDDAVADLEAGERVLPEIPDPALRQELESELSITKGRVLVASNPALAAGLVTRGLEFQEQRGNRFRTASLLLLRGRAHLASGQPALAERDWLQGITIVEDQRPAIRDAQLRVTRLSDIWELFDELTDLQRDRRDEALTTVERGHARELLDALAPASTLPAASALDRSWIPERTTVLVYAALPRRLLTWVLTRDRAELNDRAIDAPALTRLVDAHLDAIRARRPPPAALRETLVPAGLTLAPGSRLVVVPDGVLHQLPFGSLVDAQGRFLIEGTAVVVSPSLAVLRTIASRPNLPAAHDALLVAAPMARPADGLPMLRGVERELQDLVRLYPRHRRLDGATATKAETLRGLAQADVVSFGGHGVIDPVRPSRSRLLVAPGEEDDGSIHPEDVAGVAMRPGSVVVLAACETAAGATYRGEGPLNLARPFLVAGAATVVASLWKVDDDAASDLVLAFHRELEARRDPGEALAAAQRQRISENRPPADWAAFVVIGRE
jgi:tetratricopeptide (TPR) repeat protein